MRVRSAVYTRQRKKKIFRLAKGSYSNKRNRWRMVTQQVERSLRYAYRDRRDRKGVFRRLWIARVNAAARSRGLSYSRLIHGLAQVGVRVDRKNLADLAVQDSKAFDQLVELARSSPTSSKQA